MLLGYNKGECHLQGCFCIMGVAPSHSKTRYCKQDAIYTSMSTKGPWNAQEQCIHNTDSTTLHFHG